MYNFSVLNDKEFELLAKDILEKELKIKLQVFKRAPDQGVDLRYSTISENKIVVQAKHFVHTPYSKLLARLKSHELPNMKKLVPKTQRYILFTSCSLGKSQSDEIFKIMKPFIRSTNDIYGLERIIECLKDSPRIMEKHYKLWLASTDILSTILHRGAKGRSEFYEEKILKKLSLYVPTQTFKKAVKKLNENKFLIITGEPGVGKTTIAYILICDLLAQGYELLYVNDKLSDAEDLLGQAEVKQVIYFDDFLGANIAEIMNPRNSESAIVGLIDRINQSKNKFLILTSRTTILNQMNSSYEKLAHSNFARISKYKVEMGDYSRLDKAKILYNHLYQSELAVAFPDYFATFFENKNYYKIIDHDNFSPRLIEFLTKASNLKGGIGKNPLKWIVNSLDNPQHVWKQAYEDQLNDSDRFIVTTLFSLGGYNVESHVLEKAYHARHQYESRVNAIKLENDSFNRSVKKLLDGFISSQRNSRTSQNIYSFINPSIGDFVLNYMKDSSAEKFRVLKSIVFFEQITNSFSQNAFLTLTYIQLSAGELNDFFEIFNERVEYLQFATTDSPKSREVEILSIYHSFFKKKVKKSMLIRWVQNIDTSDISLSQSSSLVSVLPWLFKLSLGNDLLPKWNELIRKLLQSCRYASDFNELKDLFEECKVDLNGFLNDENNLEYWRDAITSTFVAKFAEDDNIPERINEYIREEGPYSSRSRVSDMISDNAWDEYLNFLSESGFDDYEDMVDQDLDVDPDSMADKLIRNFEYGNSDFQERVSTSSSKVSSNDTIEIDKLFER